MMVMTKGEHFDLEAEHVAKFEAELDTGKITWASKPMERMFGYLIPGELEGRSVDELVPVPKKEAHKGHRAAFAASPEPRMMGRNLKLEGQRSDGSVFPVEVMLIPRSVMGRRVVAGIVFDLTSRQPLADQKPNKDKP